MIEDLTTILDHLVLVWLAQDKTHKGEAQEITLHEHPDLQLVPRLRRWLAYLASHGITTGPLFRHVLKSGVPASAETRAKKAPVRGGYLRPATVDERVKLWFAKAGLVTDGRPVSSHGLRAGAATGLAEAEASVSDIREAGRWAEGSTIPERVYVRPVKDASKDPFENVRRPA
ncbi:hypothetical protein [Streptomyces zhihengii]|uniref:Tyr recombinase domain-containing protein n=1 Tax=Streptomyces zhihengii TaxID=1818004 RepID=A0ABS2V4M9_9ACTN|nr:hypothetical protein [Streptomyces zhihengii]MBM9624444.1 hypothetical protein [Streptomyces zhihengii]